MTKIIKVLRRTIGVVDGWFDRNLFASVVPQPSRRKHYEKLRPSGYVQSESLIHPVRAIGRNFIEEISPATIPVERRMKKPRKR